MNLKLKITNKKIFLVILSLSKKYNIVWDNDDVLVPSGSGLIDFVNKKTGKKIKSGHYTQFQKLYNINAVEETRLFDLFAELDIAGKLKPIAGMQELLLSLYISGCINYVCTARPLVTYGSVTKEWLSKYFNESINLKNLYMFEGDNEQHYAFNKFPIFETLKGDIFIDDSFHNIKSVAENCKRNVLILFQETPHNTHVCKNELPKNVISITYKNQASNILNEILKFDKKQS